MQKIFLLLIIFSLMFGCTEDNPVKSQTEEEISLLGQVDIEYIVTGPSSLRIGRDTSPGRGAITFPFEGNSWSEVIRMSIQEKDRVTLTASLDMPGKTLKLTIIANGIIIAKGESNSGVVLQYIF